MGKLHGRGSLKPSRPLNQQSSPSQLRNHVGEILTVEILRLHLHQLGARTLALLLQSLYNIRCQGRLSRAPFTGNHKIAHQRILS